MAQRRSGRPVLQGSIPCPLQFGDTMTKQRWKEIKAMKVSWPKLLWDSGLKGTYIKVKHGPLEIKQ